MSDRRPLPSDWDEHDLHAWQVLAPLRGGSYLPWSAASMRPAGLVAVLNAVALAEPALVVECGAGISTLFLARLLRQRGRGRLVSVEHDERWAGWVRRTVAAETLDDVVTVVHAPLQPGGWYAREGIDAAVGEDPIGVLLVDGPPAFAPGRGEARHPALGAFAARLAPEATVVLDDAWRPGERAVLARWQRESDLRFELRPDRGQVAIGRARGAAGAFAV